MNPKKFFYQPQIELKEDQKLITFQGNYVVNLFNIVKSQIQQGNSNITFVIENDWLTAYEPRKNKPWEEENQIEQYFGSQTLNKIFLQCFFINLQDLYLTKINIDNLQFLTFINAPKLTSIVFNLNNISNFKPLNKKAFQPYVNLIYEDNPAPHVSWQRVNQKGDSKSVVLQMQPYQNVMMQDLSGLVKLQLKSLCQLLIKGQTRIRQCKLLQKLRQKFSVWKENQLFQQVQIVEKSKYQ